MTRRTTPPPPPSREKLVLHVEQLRLYLTALRKRLYPVLSQWSKHNLTRDDNFFGFGCLDKLNDELAAVERLLGVERDEG